MKALSSRCFRGAVWSLAALLSLAACRGSADGEAVPAAASTAAPEVEECSWCPAPADPDGAGGDGGQAASPPPDLMDLLAAAASGTPFAGLTEEELLADIEEVCGAWEPGASSEAAAARTARTRAGLLGAAESAPGVDSYLQLLQTGAARRCPSGAAG